MADNRQRV